MMMSVAFEDMFLVRIWGMGMCFIHLIFLAHFVGKSAGNDMIH